MTPPTPTAVGNVPQRDFLLGTKLYVREPRPNLVSRPRLRDLLSRGLDARLILLSAPAGFGKTSLLSQWLAECDVPAAWISLDAADNDPARFVSYLIAAVRTIVPGTGRAAENLLRSPQPLPMDYVLTVLVNELSSLKQALLIVLDDYHVLTAGSVHQAVAFLLDNLPDTVHLVIATRADPPLPLARLRSRGELVEVRGETLRFTLPEATSFLNEIMRLHLTADDVAALDSRTEGWAAGLQLAALSMRGLTDVQQFILSFAGSHRYILDYLMEEVFNRQPADIQEFLLKTSILDRFTASLCRAVAGRDDSEQVLLSLEHDNLFIVPLDASRQWYRYHHLFTDLLRHRLRRSKAQDVGPSHSLASAWYEANGYPADAVHHALAGEDWDRAARLVHAVTGDLLKHGQVATLLGWFDRLPDDVVRSSPHLCLDYGWPLLLAGRLDAAESLLNGAEQQAPPAPQFLGQIAAAQAFLARARGDARRSAELSQRALSLLAEDDLVTRSVVAVNLGLAYWHVGRMTEAEAVLKEARSAALGSGNDYARLTSEIFLGRVEAVRGRLHQAAGLLRRTIETAEHTPVTAVAYLDLCTLHYEWDELGVALEHLRHGMDISKRSGDVEFQVAAHLLRARLHQAQAGFLAAREAIQEASDLAEANRASSQVLARIAAQGLECAVAEGDLAAARQWATPGAQDVDAHPFYRFLGLNRARLLVAEGQKAAAAEELQRLFEVASRASWGYGVIALRVLQCLAAATPSTAVEFLTDALKRAQPKGFVRTFADAGDPLVPLLHDAALRGVMPDYGGRILTAIGRTRRTVPADASSLPDPLSGREIEVLRLVAAGLSNREIARTLIISMGTAKTHIHNIYGKLDARNRTQAVARAKELSLL